MDGSGIWLHPEGKEWAMLMQMGAALFGLEEHASAKEKKPGKDVIPCQANGRKRDY